LTDKKNFVDLFNEIKSAWNKADIHPVYKGPLSIDFEDRNSPKYINPSTEINKSPSLRSPLSFQSEKLALHSAMRNSKGKMPPPVPRRPPPPPRPRQQQKQNKAFTRPITAAAAYSIGATTRKPVQFTTGGGTVIKHREFLGNIAGSATYTVQNTYSINPGLVGSFPWLSTQANGWEQYRFRKLCYRYLTRSTSNVAGSIMMIPEYDAADPVPPNEQIASTYDGTVEASSWVSDLCLVLDPAKMCPMGPWHFVRAGPLAANLDIKTYDAGQVFIVSNDGTTAAIGKLWVEYEVEFRMPQLLSPSFGVASGISHLAGNLSTSAFTFLLASGAPFFSANAVGLVLTLTAVQAGTFVLFNALQNTTGTSNLTSVVYGAGATQYASPANSGNWCSTTAGNSLAKFIQFSSGAAGDEAYFSAVSTPVGGTVTFTYTQATATAQFDHYEIAIPPNQLV